MVPGGVYHAIVRFVAKTYFVPSAHERRVYLAVLGRALERTTWRCFSYAVMSNHVHLALVAGVEPLKSWLRPAHTGFARWINTRLDRIGAVIVRGPNVIEYRPESAAWLMSYIHGNPVRAGVVSSFGESDWTSHRAYAGTSDRPSWLDVGVGVRLTGFDSAAALAASIESLRASRSDLDRHRKIAPIAMGPPRRLAG